MSTGPDNPRPRELIAIVVAKFPQKVCSNLYVLKITE